MSSEPPLISVVTPTKNRLALLRETVASVRTQDFARWEHIIVDDGSADGTIEEAARWAQEEPRIRFLRRKDGRAGANVCRNLGVKEARAGLIVFLDSDDLLTPDCLGRRVAAMDRNADCDFITFCNSVFMDAPGDLPLRKTELAGDDLLRFLSLEIPWIVTGPVWRKASLLRLGLLDETLPSWQDVELHIRALSSGCRYLRFPDVDHHVRYKYDPAKTSMQQMMSPVHLAASLATLEKFEGLVRAGPGMNWVRQRALCGLYFFVAERWVELGRLADAVACWRGIRRRRLGPAWLFASGSVLLALKGMGRPGGALVDRIIHKWRGWSRLRINPELVAP